MVPLLLVGAVLAVRDLVLIFIPVSSGACSPLIAAGYATSLLILVYWTGRYRRTNRSFLAALAVFVASLGLAAYAPALTRVFSVLTPIALLGTAVIALARIDRYVMTAALEIEGVRTLVQMMLLVSGIAFLVFLLASGFFRSIMVIVMTLPFWTIVLALLARSIETLHDEIQFQRHATGHIFEFLSDVRDSFSEGADPRVILAAAVETIVGASGSDAGLGIIRSGVRYQVCAVNGVFPPPVPVPAMVKTKSGALRDFLFSLVVDESTPLWGRVLKSGEPLVISDAMEDPFLRPHARDPVLHLKSVIILPLVVHDEVLGLISIARRENSRPFNSADLARTGSMAGFVSLTLDNYFVYTRLLKTRRLERDIEIAGRIQSSFQAPNDLTISNAEIAAVSDPVRGVGGDYYDVVHLDNERIALIICDVAGKGVPAALVMMIIRTAARLALESTDDAGTVLAMINSAVSGSVGDDRFATVSVIVLDPARQQLSFANAGHHPMIVVTPESAGIREEDTDGLPVGIEADAAYESRTVPFPRGSWGVLYTDGIVEAINGHGHEYGAGRLHASVKRAVDSRQSGRSARTVLDRVLSDAARYVQDAPQQDDMTVLVFRSGTSGAIMHGEER